MHRAARRAFGPCRRPTRRSRRSSRQLRFRDELFSWAATNPPRSTRPNRPKDLDLPRAFDLDRLHFWQCIRFHHLFLLVS